MAAPNIVNVSSIIGKTVGYAVTTTLTSTGVSNPSGSSKVFKINSISCSNVDGSTSADITLTIYKNQSTDFYIARYISIPPKSTLVISDKSSNPFYLEENDSIRALSSANSILQLIISYEEIS